MFIAFNWLANRKRCGTAFAHKMPNIPDYIIVDTGPLTCCTVRNKLTPQKELFDSPRLAVVLPTWPNKFVVGSQKMRSKQRITLFRLPKPSRWMASCFHVGSGGSNLTVFIWCDGGGLMATFSTPRVRVHSTRSAAMKEKNRNSL